MQLTTRINALKILSGVATFKSRLMVANGIFCSKLIFQISLWGGTEDFLLSSLQIVQNKAARVVAKRGIYTPVCDLLRQCGWLSVRQLVFYHSVILVHKTLQNKSTNYLYIKLAQFTLIYINCTNIPEYMPIYLDLPTLQFYTMFNLT